MSCSITSTEQPVCSRTRSSSGPERLGLLLGDAAADGSSSMSTFGSWARMHARSTMRRLPVDSSPVSFWRKAPRPMSSMSSSTLAATASSLS